MSPNDNSTVPHRGVASPAQLVGWVVDSGGRGTFDILSTCIVTTAICTWIVIHPRVDQRPNFRFLHKLALLFKTVIAPELIAVEAAQEWMQARRTIKQSEEAAGVRLCQEQAYYLGMFGLQYRTPNGTKVLWPNQFIWLLQQGLICQADLLLAGFDRNSINDKSNADSFAKLFALVQVAGFVLRCVFRIASRLPLAPLEAMTLGYIPLFAVTYFYWWLKPKDVYTPTLIDLPEMSAEQRLNFADMSVSEDFDHSASSKQASLWSVWALTPRVFEKEFADREAQEAQEQYEIDMSHYKALYSSSRQHDYNRLPPLPPGQRKEIVLGHWDPSLYHSRLWPLACLVGVSFPALHLISWAAIFPTSTESWLWRTAAMVSIVSMLIFMQFERVVLRWRDPLMIVKLLSPVLYLVTRMILLALAIAAFRASSSALYVTPATWAI